MLLLTFSSLVQTTEYFAESWMYMCTSLCVKKPAGLMSLNHSIRGVKEGGLGEFSGRGEEL